MDITACIGGVFKETISTSRVSSNTEGKENSS
jgi:hypothetical protein